MGNVFSIFPSFPKLFLNLVLGAPEHIWNSLCNGFDKIKIGEFVVNASIWFTNSFLEIAAKSTFWGAFASWWIGILLAELSVIFLGLANDNSLSPGQKMTVLFVDGIAAIVSNAISFVVAAVEPSKAFATTVNVISFFLPGLTDAITRYIIRKKA